VTIALVTSPGWNTRPAAAGGRPHAAARRQTTSALIYAQILIGATMRHADAGWPFRLSSRLRRDGTPHWTPQIAVHYAHRVRALVVAAAIFATAGHIYGFITPIDGNCAACHTARRLVLVQISSAA
jgi:mono/diheme cytochrome c family protein